VLFAAVPPSANVNGASKGVRVSFAARE